jgi:hypothetical protein
MSVPFPHLRYLCSLLYTNFDVTQRPIRISSIVSRGPWQLLTFVQSCVFRGPSLPDVDASGSPSLLGISKFRPVSKNRISELAAHCARLDRVQSIDSFVSSQGNFDASSGGHVEFSARAYRETVWTLAALDRVNEE